MLMINSTTTFVGGSERVHPFEGSPGDVLRVIFEDWVACDTIKFEGAAQIELWYPPKGLLSGATTVISGPHEEMAPLIYLFGIYFEQLAFAKDPFDDAAKLNTVLIACCETFNLDSEEYVPKGWPEIALHMDAWFEEWFSSKK